MEGCSRLRFAVICSAGGITTAGSPFRELFLERLCHAPNDTVLLTLHCGSQADGTSPPELVQELATCFGPLAETLWHDEGHAMPPRDWWRSSEAFMERAWDQGGRGHRGLKA